MTEPGAKNQKGHENTSGSEIKPAAPGRKRNGTSHSHARKNTSKNTSRQTPKDWDHVT